MTKNNEKEILVKIIHKLNLSDVNNLLTYMQGYERGKQQAEQEHKIPA